MADYCMYITYLWCIASMYLLWIFEYTIMDFYTKSDSVKNEMKFAWPILIIFVFFDGVQALALGNITGLGLIRKVTWVTSFDYWIIGIPTSILFMFQYNLSLRGLWVGPTVASFLNTVFYKAVIANADWQEISDNINVKM